MTEKLPFHKLYMKHLITRLLLEIIFFGIFALISLTAYFISMTAVFVITFLLFLFLCIVITNIREKIGAHILPQVALGKKFDIDRVDYIIKNSDIDGTESSWRAILSFSRFVANAITCMILAIPYSVYTNLYDMSFWGFVFSFITPLLVLGSAVWLNDCIDVVRIFKYSVVRDGMRAILGKNYAKENYDMLFDLLPLDHKISLHAKIARYDMSFDEAMDEQIAEFVEEAMANKFTMALERFCVKLIWVYHK